VSHRVKHWERPLGEGGLEIYVEVGTGRRFRVLAWPAHDARALVKTWSEQVGITLPPPEIKAQRPAPDTAGAEASRRAKARRAGAA
jgi:hypothetical protein